ncbi:hypothetical protein [Shewanella aegiceratis]|uniref:hypothetical protein n=1 Tax=Shewanella aegiceratis TaxID=2864203 RepID=UPI001C65B4F7|nr:hypothetical protein [Shewanella aegiceratis]QYJ83758.1 hypothetical protein K0H80_07025 [Shewanella aegiceratis]
MLRKNTFCLESFFICVFSFFYLVVPILYLFSFQELKENSYNFWVVKTELSFESMFWVFFIYLLSTISLFSGLYLGKKVVVRVGDFSDRKKSIFFYFLIFVSLFSSLITLVYIYKVGGVVPAIVNANLYRAHGVMEPPVGQWSKFQPYILYTSLLLMCYKSRIKYLFVVVAVVYLFIEASRANFGMYFIVLYLLYLNENHKFSFKKLLLPAIFVFLLAFLGNSITNFIETGEWSLYSSAYYGAISQFSPTFSNVLNIKEYTEQMGFGFFYDLTSIFPQTAFGIPKTVKTWELLTVYYLGGFYTVGIPIDLFSYGFSQFSFFGSFALPFSYGVLLGLGIKYLKAIRFKSGDFKLAYGIELIMCLFALSILNWASLDSTVFYGTSKYWLLLLVFYLVSKLRLGDFKGASH